MSMWSFSHGNLDCFYLYKLRSVGKFLIKIIKNNYSNKTSQNFFAQWLSLAKQESKAFKK